MLEGVEIGAWQWDQEQEPCAWDPVTGETVGAVLGRERMQVWNRWGLLVMDLTLAEGWSFKPVIFRLA